MLTIAYIYTLITMVDITLQVCVNIGCAKEWVLTIVVYGVGELIVSIYVVYIVNLNSCI